MLMVRTGSLRHIDDSNRVRPTTPLPHRSCDLLYVTCVRVRYRHLCGKLDFSPGTNRPYRRRLVFMIHFDVSNIANKLGMEPIPILTALRQTRVSGRRVTIWPRGVWNESQSWSLELHIADCPTAIKHKCVFRG
jgi:hypothetical protein